MTIKEARIIAGLEKKEVADLLEIPERTYRAWENGERVPPKYVEKMVIEKLQRIAEEQESK